MSVFPLRFIKKIFLQSVLILLFLLALFYSILLVYGYQIDPTTSSLSPRGILNLSKVTPNSSIFLNNQPHPEKTPLFLNDLPLENQHLSLQKPNHHPWEKEIQIKQNYVTSIGEIKLIPKNKPTPITTYSSPQNLFSPHPSGKKYAIYTSKNQEIQIYNSENQILISIPSPTSHPQELKWIGKNLYLQDKNDTLFQLTPSKTWQKSNLSDVLSPSLREKELFSSNQKQFLHLQNQEIWINSLDQETNPTLFGRFLSPTHWATWFSENQIIFSTNSTIYICDTDHQNCIPLTTHDSNLTPFFLPSTQTLFFTQNNTLFSLDLSSQEN